MPVILWRLRQEDNWGSGIIKPFVYKRWKSNRKKITEGNLKHLHTSTRMCTCRHMFTHTHKNERQVKRETTESFALRSEKHWGANLPLLRLEARRGVPWDEEEGSHGMHVTEGCGRPKTSTRFRGLPYYHLGCTQSMHMSIRLLGARDQHLKASNWQTIKELMSN